MIRRMFAVAVLVLLATSVKAQIPYYPNGCPSCYTLSAIDIPWSDGSVVGSQQPWGIAGWSFLCETGRGPDRIDLFWETDDGWMWPVPPSAVSTYRYTRSDVSLAFVTTCPNVWWYDVGYTVIIAGGAVPPGTRHIIVNAWTGTYLSQRSVRLVFE